MQIDRKIALGCEPWNDSLTLTSFDIRNAQSSPLTHFTDKNFKGGTVVRNIIIDSADGLIIVVAEKSVALYHYETTAIGVKNGRGSVKTGSRGALTVHSVAGGVIIDVGPVVQHVAGLLIYDLAGRMVRHFTAAQCGGSGVVFWDKKSETGQALAPGSYFLTLRRPDGVTTGKIVLCR